MLDLFAVVNVSIIYRTSQEIHKYFICMNLPNINEFSFASYQLGGFVFKDDLNQQVTELKSISHVNMIVRDSAHYLSMIAET